MKSQTLPANAQAPSAHIVLDTEKRTWWNGLTEQQRGIITWFAIILGISLTAMIAIWFAKRKVQNFVSKKEQDESFGKDKHATWAKQLKMAFDNDGWWGTDEAAVRRVMVAIPSQEDFAKVQDSYRRLYKGQNLTEAMTDELKATEYNEMLAILQSKPRKAKDGTSTPPYDPKGWAKRLYNAMSIYYVGFIPGTDDAAIKAVFSEMPTQKAFVETARAYRTLYSVSLVEDLDGDLDWTMDWRALIKKKPKG